MTPFVAQDFGLSDEEEEKLNKEQTASVDGMFGSYGDALNPKVIAVTDYLDPHPLNKAEWTKFIGAFFNLEDVAEKYMKEQEKRWDALVQKGNADATKPLVFCSRAGDRRRVPAMMLRACSSQ